MEFRRPPPRGPAGRFRVCHWAGEKSHRLRALNLYPVEGTVLLIPVHNCGWPLVGFKDGVVQYNPFPQNPSIQRACNHSGMRNQRKQITAADYLINPVC